jgi:hypothetical protein
VLDWRIGVATLAVVALGALVPASATSAVIVGQTFEPTSTCEAPGTILQSASPAGAPRYVVETRGVLTSWSFQAPAQVAPIRLKVGANVSGDSFRIDAQSEIETPIPNELNRFSEISVPVEPGDLIGLFFAGAGDEVPCGAPTLGYDFHFLGADVAPGSAQAWSAGDGLGLQLDLSATLEADADADGFGDETEDRCPTDAATHRACPANEPRAPVDEPDSDPPETTIIKPAPEKLEGRRVKFRFITDDAGATFRCKLDRRRYRRCRSPKWVKHLDEGRHVFRVRAVDAAGNVDPSPARDGFKVVG